MKRIPSTLAAMAAAAAVTAAITIPAVAQSSGSDKDGGLVTFTACLAAHGVDVPAGLDAVAVKQWLGARQDDATVRAALSACVAGDNAKADQVYTCLKAHGVDVADDPYAIKRKVAELAQTDAGKATLSACHIIVDDHPKPGDCGKPAPPADYPAEKAQRS